MTVELLQKKYPIGTRVMIHTTDGLFQPKDILATVTDHADNSLFTKGDDGHTRVLDIGHDRFAVVYRR